MRRTLLLLSLPLIGWMSVLAALIQPVSAAATPGAAVPISPAGISANAPALVITRQDALHIVWEQDGGLWHRQRQNGLWSTAQAIVAEGENPVLAADPYGEIVYLAWEQEFGGNYEIFARKWDSVQGWSEAHNVSSNDGGSASPALTVGPNGVIHLFWTDTTPGSSTIYHASSTDGESWPVALPIADAKGGNPTAAFDAAGHLRLAWQYRPSFADNLRIWTAHYVNNAWTAPTALTDGSQQAFGASMAGGGGLVALSWQEGEQAVLASLTNDVWQVVATQTGAAPAPAITNSGIMQWAWENNPGLARQFGRGGWTTPQVWAATDSSQPALASQNERIGVVWVEKQEGIDRVFYNSDIFDTMWHPVVFKQ